MARSDSRASVFGLFVTASRSPASFAPNHSFKPTPHRGGNSVLCATLHAVATPLRGGLNQALGGEKRAVVVLPATAVHLLRLVVLCGHLFGAFSLRQALHARSGATCVAVLGFGSTDRLTVGIPDPDGVASVTVD